jgi:hypothetical protein
MNELIIPPGIMSLTPTTVKFGNELTQAEWRGLWKPLSRMYASINWWLGAWLDFGLTKFTDRPRLAPGDDPEKKLAAAQNRRCVGYAEAMAITGETYQHLRNCLWVHRAVPLSSREDKLSWHHHQIVAALPHEDQRRFLTRALEEGWSLPDLRMAICQDARTAPEPVGPMGFAWRAWGNEARRNLAQRPVDKMTMEERREFVRATQPIVAAHAVASKGLD